MRYFNKPFHISFFYVQEVPDSFGSISFPKTTYDDVPFFDWIIVGNNFEQSLEKQNYTSYLKNMSSGGSFLDLRQVTYLKNKDYLNATLIFNDQLSKLESLPKISFGVLIDADLDSRTGKEGWDYAVTVSLTNETQIRKFFEIFSDGFWKERSESYGSRSISVGDRTVDVYLQLSEINSPDKFRFAFFSNNHVKLENDDLQIIDMTDWIVIPLTRLIWMQNTPMSRYPLEHPNLLNGL